MNAQAFVKVVCVLAIVAAAPLASSASRSTPDLACAIEQLKKSEVQGLKMYSPDRSRFLVNKEDDKGVHQIYIGKDGSSELTCITCVLPRPTFGQQRRCCHS
ncbi:MAG: hypothetical protein H0V63_10985 [Burkholderiaceae bacterium]|nr:hypothetical protein [Burkholderiaceae bacterium]